MILKFQILKKFERNSKSKTQKKNRKPTQTKFSSIMDLLNGLIFDEIIGNYKQAESPLMHQNLENIQELITKKQFSFLIEDTTQWNYTPI